MTEPERIEYIIANLTGGSGQRFAQKLGISTTAVSNMRSGKFGIRLKIDAILEAFPQINRSWLETGEGYPGDLTVDLVKAHYEAKIKRNERVIDNLIGRIEELEKQLGAI
jgi:transcriptional regulator with XRE-family HTH domain